MELWPSIRSRPYTTINQFAGVSRLDPFSISPNKASAIKNLSSTLYPALSIKPGYSFLGAAIGTKILGLGVWKDTELHAVFNDGTWRKWTGAAWSAALASGLSATAEWSFCNFQGNLAGINLIGSNGVDAIKRYDGATVANLATAPAGGNFIEQHDNRLYCAVGNELHFSTLRIADDWTTVNLNDEDPGTIVIETNNGELINGLKAGSGHIIVYKPSTTHELYGTSASDYRKVDVADDIGLVNNKCIVNLNGITYSMDYRGIYRYSGGSRPDKAFCIEVQKYVDDMNQTAKSKCCMGTDGLKLYVAIPVTSSTATDTILEYDPKYGTWFVWEDESPLFMAKMGANWYLGDANARIYQRTGTSAAGTAISWRWVSKPFGAQSLSQKIRWYQAWVVANVPVGSTMSIYLSKLDSGDSDWTLVSAITAEAVLNDSRLGIPTTTAANAQWIRLKIEGTGPCEIKEFTRDERTMPIV